ncbi:MAG: hypothetical protein F6K41_15615 [Symploca sp. SIO3E6]|nr:hypothetical protein [Caldora sp. SIO3E6]
MARLYADENFPLPVVRALRSLGEDVLTAQEAKKANLRIPDDEVLAFATSKERAVLTRNRRDFIRLHLAQPNHAGIVVCTEEQDVEGLAKRIHQAISIEENIRGKLIRVNRPQK